MFKIGVGPSSSHTLGPWRAAERFLQELISEGLLDSTANLRVELYGSLALTGIGHGTPFALIMGLSGLDPSKSERGEMDRVLYKVHDDHKISLNGIHLIDFNPDEDILMQRGQSLPFHSNGMRFVAEDQGQRKLKKSEYYSVGGGFIVAEGDQQKDIDQAFPYPIQTAKELINHCQELNKNIAEVIWLNELSLRRPYEIENKLWDIWNTMKKSIYEGCHREGILPGGLNLRRRAPGIHKRLMPHRNYSSLDEWIHVIRSRTFSFESKIDWISCFALAVNEENANFGRIVTAPTNGSAGVIPAVLLYAICFDPTRPGKRDIIDFLLVASEIGSIFKKGATISAAAGGCQAEIGVSSAMAAAALSFLRGGSTEQCLMAAEIAMEHHLGLTCDPIGGLVQIPCIERNSMGAIKAITSSGLALKSQPEEAKVSLDAIIQTMWQTAQDMNSKYKETSLGGLATTVSRPEC